MEASIIVYVTLLTIWSFLYFNYSVFQDVTGIDQKALDRSVNNSRYFFYAHTFIYVLLLLIASKFFYYGYWGEFWALASAVPFSFLVYGAENEGIITLNRSIQARLPSAVSFVDNSVYYRRRYQL